MECDLKSFKALEVEQNSDGVRGADGVRRGPSKTQTFVAELSDIIESDVGISNYIIHGAPKKLECTHCAFAIIEWSPNKLRRTPKLGSDRNPMGRGVL